MDKHHSLRRRLYSKEKHGRDDNSGDIQKQGRGGEGGNISEIYTGVMTTGTNDICFIKTGTNDGLRSS